MDTDSAMMSLLDMNPEDMTDRDRENLMGLRDNQRRQTEADGWTKIKGKGAAVWFKDGKYLDMNFKPVSAAVEKANVVAEARREAEVIVGAMSRQELAMFIMGDEITTKGLQVGLDGDAKSDKVFLKQFTDAKLKSYLESIGVELTASMKRAHLDQLVVSHIETLGLPQDEQDRIAAEKAKAKSDKEAADAKAKAEEAAKQKAQADAKAKADKAQADKRAREEAELQAEIYAEEAAKSESNDAD